MALSDLLNVTQIYDLVKKGATLEAQEAILKYREEIVNLTEESLDLKKALSELKNQIGLEKELQYTGEAYYRISSEDQRDGPFCQRCYDVDGKLVRMVNMTSNRRRIFYCKHCQKTYQAPA